MICHQQSKAVDSMIDFSRVGTCNILWTKESSKCFHFCGGFIKHPVAREEHSKCLPWRYNMFYLLSVNSQWTPGQTTKLFWNLSSPLFQTYLEHWLSDSYTIITTVVKTSFQCNGQAMDRQATDLLLTRVNLRQQIFHQREQRNHRKLGPVAALLGGNRNLSLWL